jgi:hypothetical protein
MSCFDVDNLKTLVKYIKEIYILIAKSLFVTVISRYILK